MTNLTRREPFSEMLSLRDAINQLFDQSVVHPTLIFGRQTPSVPVNVSERDDAFVVEAAVPGVEPHDLNVTLQDNVLTISAETKEEQERGAENANFHLKERRYGRFSRTVAFPTSVNADQCNATFENGILRLEIKKAEGAKPRKIAVQGRQALQGQPVDVPSEPVQSRARGQ